MSYSGYATTYKCNFEGAQILPLAKTKAFFTPKRPSQYRDLFLHLHILTDWRSHFNFFSVTTLTIISQETGRYFTVIIYCSSHSKVDLSSIALLNIIILQCCCCYYLLIIIYWQDNLVPFLMQIIVYFLGLLAYSTYSLDSRKISITHSVML